ncbi:hypothetical protein [Luteimonas saliphila]|uniref:hypothetical protein n=1 Tax=Luteimonas saliphila TaxID=2804919 RepID=UPI00192D995D|nr:hypothetical protein [Luteimonas saliphila]
MSTDLDTQLRTGYTQHPQDVAECRPGSDTHTVEDGEIASLQFVGDDATIDMGDKGDSWANTSLGAAMEGNVLHLNRITPEMLKDLSPSNLNGFMDTWMAGRDFSVSVNGRNTELNGATAIAAMAWASGDSVAFAKAFAAAPEHVLDYLTGNGSRVLTAENMTLIMREMSASADYWDGSKAGYETGELDALGDLVQIYLDKNAGDDPQAVVDAVEQLIAEVGCSMPFTPENAGAFNGVLISGMLKHFDAINASDATRNSIINGLAGVTGTIAAGFGPWGVAAAAGISALNSVYQGANPPRDFEEVANRVQAEIQLQWLQHPPEGWTSSDVGNAIDWTNTTILANGQR